MEDRRCKLGLLGRLELVGLVEAGSTLRAAAAALSVAPATAHRWWHRWKDASQRPGPRSHLGERQGARGRRGLDDAGRWPVPPRTSPQAPPFVTW